MPCLRMSVNRLREGMMIKEDVFSKTGAVIVPDGAVVTKDVVALLTRHFVDSVMVEYPTGRKERPEQQEQSAPAKEQHLKEFQAEFSVAEQSISEELKDIVYRSKDVNISMLLEPLNGLLKKADDDTDLADMLLHMKNSSQVCTHIPLTWRFLDSFLHGGADAPRRRWRRSWRRGCFMTLDFLNSGRTGRNRRNFCKNTRRNDMRNMS